MLKVSHAGGSKSNARRGRQMVSGFNNEFLDHTKVNYFL
jgi:hypothetical protein